MSEHPAFQECRSYVAAHLHAHPRAHSLHHKSPPAFTISRQAGARGRTIGRKLQNALRARDPKSEIPWTLFDEDLVQKVLEDHQLPADLEKFMPDDATGEVETAINEILGRHPSLWSLFEKTTDTILRLSRMGHCILVGRGGNLVTRGLPNVIRVRLIGGDKRRLHQMTSVHGMPLKEAQQYIKDEDTARARYMKKHFNADVDNPADYDLVINTDKLSDEAVVALLVSAMDKI